MVKFVCDSSCDMLTMPGVCFEAVPLTISTEERRFVDDASLDLDDMLDYLAAYKGRSYSACPGIGDWLKAYSGADTVYAAVLTFTAEGVLSLFGAADPLIVLLGARALLIQVYALVLMPFNFSGNSLLQSVGEAWKSTFLAALPQGVFYVPAVLLLPLLMGQSGVLLAPALGQALAAVVSAPVIRGYWRRMGEG